MVAMSGMLPTAFVPYYPLVMYIVYVIVSVCMYVRVCTYVKLYPSMTTISCPTLSSC